ncbi:hypothetical protein PQS90_09070 [Pseudomonas sp. BLCC-B13]|uniref:hypothetical protein n=1 Tax=Pseudomonas sp. BLCC-B13 TaxID=3025314 RepID=UPI00234E4672|nr:hypothetical protein [Pseudomonas sp. BLCC-B13]MDC7825300.1 hypothetical protein [Pseudomonas sp. BLCC-B13]
MTRWILGFALSIAAFAASAAPAYLLPRHSLQPGQFLQSPNKVYSLHMQTDGNLVLYKNGFEPKWSTGTHVKGGYKAKIEMDLNVYSADGKKVWSSDLYGPIFEEMKDRAYLVVQDDGNVVIVMDDAVWGYVELKKPDPNAVELNILPGTYKPGTTWVNGGYRLQFQGDGNLVVYRSDNKVIWHTHTYNKGATRAVMQADGNFVIYAGNTPLWDTKTAGRPGSYLQFTNYGRLFVIQPRPVWGLFGVPRAKPRRVVDPDEGDHSTFPIYTFPF